MSHEPSLRDLPAVHAILDHPGLSAAIASVGRERVADAVRFAIEEARESLRAARPVDLQPSSLVRRALSLTLDAPNHLRPVINATGILLNTGLGRAPLALGAIEAVAKVAAGYCNLEYDLETGTRGDRTSGVEELLCRLTGCEAATVVNNNAAATVLTLRALANGREVVVSRGQLIEIGGSFRLPEIFEASGARLREVGTTNRTRLDDYERAIGPETAALLRVHPSNFRIVGFTESVGIAALADLAHRRGIACIDDVGSGLLSRDLHPKLDDEPSVREGIQAGADVVLCSGDKLLGGPQSGLILGRKAAIDRIASDPLMRAMRVDKMTLAALNFTLEHLSASPHSPGHNPLHDLLDVSVERLQARAEAIVRELSGIGFQAMVVPSEAMLGGGSDPARPIGSRAVKVSPPFPGPIADWNEADLARGLRIGETSIVARVSGGTVWVDLKAVFPDGDAAIVEALTRMARPPS